MFYPEKRGEQDRCRRAVSDGPSPATDDEDKKRNKEACGQQQTAKGALVRVQGSGCGRAQTESIRTSTAACVQYVQAADAHARTR